MPILTEQTIEHLIEYLEYEIFDLIRYFYLILTSIYRTESVILIYYIYYLQLLSYPNIIYLLIKYIFYIFFIERPSCCIKFFARYNFPVVSFEKLN